MNKKILVLNLTLSILLLALCIKTSNLYAGNIKNWQLVYEVDENNNVIRGSFNALRNALSNGASLRVMANWTDYITGYNIRAYQIYSDYIIAIFARSNSSGHYKLKTDGTVYDYNNEGTLLNSYTAPLKWFVNK